MERACESVVAVCIWCWACFYHAFWQRQLLFCCGIYFTEWCTFALEAHRPTICCMWDVMDCEFITLMLNWGNGPTPAMLLNFMGMYEIYSVKESSQWSQWPVSAVRERCYKQMLAYGRNWISRDIRFCANSAERMLPVWLGGGWVLNIWFLLAVTRLIKEHQ